MARILLAEDDDSLRHFLQRALERAGHEVLSVSRGDQALPVIAEGRFDLLLADIVMPEMDGIQLAQRAVSIDPRIKVMFITGFAGSSLLFCERLMLGLTAQQLRAGGRVPTRAQFDLRSD